MKFFIALFFSLFILPAEAVTDAHTDRTTEAASALVSEYVKTEDISKPAIINKMKTLVDENPKNINIRNMYLSLLLAEQQYDTALQQLQVLNKEKQNKTGLLTECMLKERIRPGDARCFESLIAQYDKENEKDASYLTALFMAKDKRFEAEKQKQLSDGKITNEEASHYTLSREAFLHELFP
ncbi:hypothetical protein [Dryocola clanedunensis]|uniref:hypothetical protein n=1 Tax=Cedecea sulfonylureivorans TaxID=3051154 RepID=UPI0019276097|nr:hypothetical protein [Cedecea sulfonylureivorans]